MVDGGPNANVNYEPSVLGQSLKEAPKPAKDYHQPVEGHLGRYQTSRTTDDYTQAGERYRTFEDWERDDLIANLVDDMKHCPEPIQLRMVWHFWHCDEDYGRRVAEGAGIDLEKAKALPPLPGRAAPHKALDGRDLHGRHHRRRAMPRAARPPSRLRGPTDEKGPARERRAFFRSSLSPGRSRIFAFDAGGIVLGAERRSIGAMRARFEACP